MRKLNKVSNVKKDTVEVYNHCSYNCVCAGINCVCIYNIAGLQNTKVNNRYSAYMRKSYDTYNYNK